MKGIKRGPNLPNLPNIRVFWPIVVGALATMVAVATAVHGIIKPLLVERGIRGWSWIDTLGAGPIIWFGAGLLGAGAGVGAETSAIGAWAWAAAPAMIVLGWLAIVLGVTELRKLH